MKSEHIVVFVTAKDSLEAERLSQSLLNEKLAACVNIINGVESFFWWGDKVDKANEILLVVKSRTSCLANIIKSVKKYHSYNVPEIIALPIIGGNEDYLNWINESVKGA